MNYGYEINQNNARKIGGAYRRWFSPGSPVSSTNKTDRHDITEILLKVTLNTITLKWHSPFDFYKSSEKNS
jgi:hypothetical protein